MNFSNKQTQIVAGGALILAVIGGGWWLAGRNRTRPEPIAPEITLEPSEQIATQLPSPMSETEKQAIDDAFAKTGAEMTLLKDVSGGQAVGTAWRQYDGSRYYHKVEVNNLPATEKGFYYEGWLVGEAGFFSTGRVAVTAGRGTLYYASVEDKTAFSGVVITVEPEDGSEVPDKHILEGSF